MPYVGLLGKLEAHYTFVFVFHWVFLQAFDITTAKTVVL